jgi:hypothetical protein
MNNLENLSYFGFEMRWLEAQRDRRLEVSGTFDLCTAAILAAVV